MSYNNLEQLAKEAFNDILLEVIEEVAIEAMETIKDMIEKDIYQFGDEKRQVYYDDTASPTGEFGQTPSITKPKVINGEVQSRVYHDTKKMKINKKKFKHGSNFWDMTDVRSILPEILNDNLSGSIFDSKSGDDWWHDRRPYFDDALADLIENDRLFEMFKSRLKKRGIVLEE